MALGDALKYILEVKDGYSKDCKSRDVTPRTALESKQISHPNQSVAGANDSVGTSNRGVECTFTANGSSRDACGLIIYDLG